MAKRIWPSEAISPGDVRFKVQTHHHNRTGPACPVKLAYKEGGRRVQMLFGKRHLGTRAVKAVSKENRRS